MLQEIYKYFSPNEASNWLGKVEAVKQNFPLSGFCSNEVTH